MRYRNAIKNFKTSLFDPKILIYYIPWCIKRFSGRPLEFEIAGGSIGGFPNFSSYLGAVRNALTRHEMEFSAPRLAGAEIIFDVGANFGAFVIPFARLAPAARLFAFEPNPNTARALRENLIRNSITNVVVVECAVSHSDGEITFSDSSDPATNRILGNDDVGLSVQCRSLTSFCRENNINRIDFLKIDVEGAEMDVLEGAEELFSGKKVMSGMIEICPGNLNYFGRSIAELDGFMKKCQYNFQLIGDMRDKTIHREIVLENAAFYPMESI